MEAGKWLAVYVSALIFLLHGLGTNPVFRRSDARVSPPNPPIDSGQNILDGLLPPGGFWEQGRYDRRISPRFNRTEFLRLT